MGALLSLFVSRISRGVVGVGSVLDRGHGQAGVKAGVGVKAG